MHVAENKSYPSLNDYLLDSYEHAFPACLRQRIFARFESTCVPSMTTTINFCTVVVTRGTRFDYDHNFLESHMYVRTRHDYDDKLSRQERRSLLYCSEIGLLNGWLVCWLAGWLFSWWVGQLVCLFASWSGRLASLLALLAQIA